MAETPQVVEATKETLTRKVGPAPVWVYVALGAGVLFIVSRRRRTAGGSTASGEVVPQAVDTWMPSTATMPQGYIPSTVETNADTVAIYTNDDWVVEGARRMAATHSDNTVVIRRLRQYVGGGSYPQGEYDATVAAAEEAIRLVGPPPEPVGPLAVSGVGGPGFPVPNPSPTPGPLPLPAQPGPANNATNNGSDVTFTIGQFGGSLESAADHYFGDPNAWYKFRVGNDPSSGWLNPQSYMELATGVLPYNTVLTVGPSGRIRD